MIFALCQEEIKNPLIRWTMSRLGFWAYFPVDMIAGYEYICYWAVYLMLYFHIFMRLWSVLIQQARIPGFYEPRNTNETIVESCVSNNGTCIQEIEDNCPFEMVQYARVYISLFS